MPAKKHILTGADSAFVNTKRPAPNHVVLVKEGEELPSDLADGELERLTDLGAFNEHPRDLRAKAIELLGKRSEDLPIADSDVEAMLAALDGATSDDADERVAEAEAQAAAEKARADAAEQELAALQAAGANQS